MFKRRRLVGWILVLVILGLAIMLPFLFWPRERLLLERATRIVPSGVRL